MKYVGPFAALRTLDWSVCIGGSHITGEIRVDGKTIELERPLSLQEAKELGEKDGREWLYKYDRKTNRFNSNDQIEKFAVEWCDQNMESDYILFDYDTYGVNRPIHCSGKYDRIFESLKEIYDVWNNASDHAREENWKEIDELWNRLIKF